MTAVQTKTVFITGASSGIGYATARLFQVKGWNVVATLSTPEQSEALAALPPALCLSLDVNHRAITHPAV